MDLTKTTAIVTGASSGIGRATARRLGAEGANVVLAARRKERLAKLQQEITGEGGSALAVVTDVTQPDDWKRLVEQTTDAFGAPDVLINNAGLMPLSQVAKLKVDEWMRMVDVNLKGVLYGVAAVLPAMRERGSGHIVNVSSVAGRRLFPGGAVYCATKFAVRAFSEGLRSELGPGSGIRVTSIEPGAVDTELTDTITDEDLLGKLEAMFADMTPLESEDIAAAIQYALVQPDRVNVEELIVMPTTQG